MTNTDLAADRDEPSDEDETEARARADHDLVMETARRIIAADAAIIHRLGTI
jgi:hypothetical protein